MFRKKSILIIIIIICLGISAVGVSANALATPECAPAYVKQLDTVFTVLPTGTNDTANIQCAFDAAVNTGPGSVVKLMSGTYYIDRDIVVVNFDGTFTGAGKDNTYVQNIDLDPFPPHSDPYPFPGGGLDYSCSFKMKMLYRIRFQFLI